MFEIGQVYRRRDLHQKYGGQEQGGISTPANHPFIMIFTGDSGEPFGYRDQETADGLFHYTGEGQVGDMEFRAGNRAIRDHVENGEDLYLFRIRGHGTVECLGQMTCVGYDLVGKIPDRNGNPRTVIVFKLMHYGD